MLRKVSPLAGWTTKDVWAYAKAHDIPLLPLYDLGYTSIGCEPCTSLPLDPGNDRSGRWQGQKLECGIHIQSEGLSANAGVESSRHDWSLRCRLLTPPLADDSSVPSVSAAC